MGKPMTWRKGGAWGIEGVDLAALPPKAYGALRKLLELEHPLCPTNADRIRTMSDEELAAAIICPNESGLEEVPCELDDGRDCFKCCLDWLRDPAREQGP